MRVCIFFAVLALGQSAAPLWSQTTESAACYTAQAADLPHDVSRLTITRSGEITLGMTGAPFVTFDYDCDFAGQESVECSVDCDGGRVYLEKTPEGILSRFEGLRFEAVRMESLTFGLVQFDADGLSYRGTHLLTPAPDEQCRRDTTGQPFVLRPGDLYPAVERLETYLASAGYLAEPPDWSYTAETAAAVRAFQTEMGELPTGITDRALMRRIGVFTQYGFGGC